MWAMIGVACWSVASRNHPSMIVTFSVRTVQLLQKDYGSSFRASACQRWFLKPVTEFFCPWQTKIFPCVVSKEPLMLLGRNTAFETTVPPKLSHPMHKKDFLQPVMIPEWNLEAGPWIFQKYQQHRVFLKTLSFMMIMSVEVHCHSLRFGFWDSGG